MLFQKIRNFSHTLSFRLTFWYAGIFMVSSLLLLILFYHFIASEILEALDSQLEEEITEFHSLLAEGGLEEVKRYLVIEVESESEDTFFRLVSIIDGQEIAMAKNFSVTDMQPLSKFVRELESSSTDIFATVNLPGYPNALRTVTGKIGQGLLLQVGESFVHDEKVLSQFKQQIFFIVLPLLFLSAAIGWFLARRALKEVEQITLTAEKIAEGDYSQRVRLKRSALEIEKLAGAFNAMLDRIQALIKGMREVTDNIAHDLRSPLARIRGKAEMTLIRPNSLSNDNDLAASTIEECDNLIDMINTMLDITEAEAGTGNIQPESVAMNDLIQSACELFEPIAKEKDIRLKAVLPEDHLHIQGDRHKLQRLVTNLIENGIKYNRPGGDVTVTVTTKGQWLYIRFEDSGYGIPASDLPRIFDRFYRCDASRSEPGLGLGLSLAKAIVQASGGDISAESKINQGSLFTVRFPL